MTPSAGMHLGRYELVRPLGAGGMGEVWEAQLHGPEGFRKQVALKLLRQGPSGDDHARSALLQEARLGALLCHPNVVGTWELGRVDGRWFVAMELVRGVSAADLVRFGALDPAAAIDLGLQVCSGLAHIHGLRIEGHARGLVHRDIKPANLLVDRTGLVKVADLGIARLQGGTDGDAVGTPGYMSPEQTRGQTGPASDLFSLGVVLYRLVTGQMPFGRGLRALARVHQADQLLDRGLLEPVRDLAPGLDDVLRLCLSGDLQRRPTSAGALAEALRTLPIPSGRGLAEVLQERLTDLRSDEMVANSSGRRVFDPSAETVVLTQSPPDNLPSRGTALIGRQDEVDGLMDQLDAHPVVTLRGPPGVGKTRLALEVAFSLRPAFPGGTFWVRCEEARTVQGLCAALADVLELRLGTATPIRELAETLATRESMLLVLDNLEQVAEDAAEALAVWTVAAPSLRFLTTSRLPLRVTGEHVQDVQPLDAGAAIRLFEALAPGPIAEGERAAVAALVERLDRLPLAIDLAAARATVLSPTQLLARIDERFRLLTRTGRGGDSRHRSLFAALEASWELLETWEQQAYAQLSVFADGFDVESAEAVLALGPEAPWALDVLTALIEHSLVHHDRTTQRFSMLPTVREHAASHLQGDERARAELRHGELCVRLTAGDTQRVGLWLRERENLIVALRRALDRRDGPMAASVGRVVVGLFVSRGPLPAAIDLSTEILDMPDLGDDRTRILIGRGSARRMSGRFEAARDDLEEALRLSREAGDVEQQGHALVDLGNLVREEGGSLDEAGALVEEALSLCGREHPRVRARALTDLGVVLRLQGDLTAALSHQREALRLNRALGRRLTTCAVLNNLGIVLAQSGDYDGGREHYEQAIRLARELDSSSQQLNPTANLANLEHELGNLPRAVRLFSRAIRMGQRLGSPLGTAGQRTNLAAVFIELGDLDAARSEVGLASEILDRYAPTPLHSLPTGNLATIARLEGRMQEAEALYEEALAVEEAYGDAPTVLLYQVALADLHRVTGRAREGLIRATAALAQAEEIDDFDGLAELRLTRGLCLVELDRPGDAHQDLDAALQSAPPRSTRAARALCGLARVHAALGDLPEATRAVDRARGVSEQLGAGPRSMLAVELTEASAALQDVGGSA